mmetsp:Transcript_12508/g.29562  ORF Transcript_12508/g.29562 Transcript_12508/m.29562 type:complete len:200 (+) Transcript_12508:211-810(+)
MRSAPAPHRTGPQRTLRCVPKESQQVRSRQPQAPWSARNRGAPQSGPRRPGSTHPRRSCQSCLGADQRRLLPPQTNPRSLQPRQPGDRIRQLRSWRRPREPLTNPCCHHRKRRSLRWQSLARSPRRPRSCVRPLLSGKSHPRSFHALSRSWKYFCSLQWLPQAGAFAACGPRCSPSRRSSSERWLVTTVPCVCECSFLR